MKLWTGLWTSAALAASCLALGGCSDDGLGPGLGGSSGSTSSVSSGTSLGTTTSTTNNGQTSDESGTGGPTGPDDTTQGATTLPPDGTTSSTTDPEPTTDSGSTDTGSTDSGSTDSGSTDSGSTDSGSTGTTGTTGGSSSTGPMGNAYQGDYDGTWEGMCPGIGMVNGTFLFTVDMAGILMGDIMGFDTGPMDGTVDDMGVVTVDVMANLGGMCTFDGQIDMMGDVTGNWSCPMFACMGTWMGSVQP